MWTCLAPISATRIRRMRNYKIILRFRWHIISSCLLVSFTCFRLLRFIRAFRNNKDRLMDSPSGKSRTEVALCAYYIVVCRFHANIRIESSLVRQHKLVCMRSIQSRLLLFYLSPCIHHRIMHTRYSLNLVVLLGICEIYQQTDKIHQSTCTNTHGWLCAWHAMGRRHRPQYRNCVQ